MENYFNKEKEVPNFPLILKSELEDMIERRPERANPGYEEDFDPKFIILKKVVKQLETSDFKDIYEKLDDFEKHAIITRLENRAYLEQIDHNVVDEMRMKLYGADPEDSGSINNLEQERLDKELYERYKNKQNG